MRERAEQCRLCSDENVLGKERLNLSALEKWLTLEGGGGGCCCWVPASEALPDPLLRESSQRQGRAFVPSLPYGIHRVLGGPWDGEAETCLALTVGCEPWGLCCSLGLGSPGEVDGSGSSRASRRACIFLPAVAMGCSSKTWLCLLSSSTLSSCLCSC